MPLFKQAVMLQHADEGRIILRAQNGDEAAFEELIVFYSPALFRVVVRMARDASEAEAIVQEAFWRTWRSLGRYHRDQPFFPYLVTIALNLLRDQWRKDKWVECEGLGSDFDLETASAPDVETLVEEREVRNDLENAIHELPSPYRAVIELRYEEEMNYEEIARIMQSPINTIRTHLHRAKKLLQQGFEEKDWTTSV
jgi:RNA polymerase sigma-70 factor, ECF subfamily